MTDAKPTTLPADLEARLVETLPCLGDEYKPAPCSPKWPCEYCAARPAVRALLVEVAKGQWEKLATWLWLNHKLTQSELERLYDEPLVTDAGGKP